MMQDNPAVARLKARFDPERPAIAMAAHNPLAAKLAAAAGFDAIWGSGFELSASYAVPDANILSVDTHLELMRAIGEVQDAPVIADIDTGYGNAVNVAYLVPRYAAAGVAAVVIEDKTFPKVTSLAADARQELVRIAEFQGKIEAAVAARRDPDFLIVARTEALIAGLGQTEALTRAAAYAEAGADMILVHSKQKTPDEIERFVKAWTGTLPIAIVPTAYPQLNEARIRALGKIAMVIYGNHAIRAAVTAMQDVFARIIADGGIHAVDKDIVPVEEIFRLQRMDQIKAAERKFLR